MELSPLQFLLFASVPLLLGSALLRCLGIGPRTDPVAYPGWAWMAGALAVAALEAASLLAGLGSLTPGLAVVVAIAAAGGLFLSARKTALLGADEPAPRPAARWETWLFRVALALVLAVMLRRILAGSLAAIVAGDEANVWSVRAKYLFDAQGFGGSYARAVDALDIANPGYPLLNPLLQLWTFDCAGAVVHTASRLPIQLSTLALVLCAASAFRRLSRPWIAAVLLLVLVACAPFEQALRRATSDLMVAFGSLAAADALLRSRSSVRPASWLGLTSLALAFLLGSKREGLLILVAGAAGLVLCAWSQGRLRWPALRRTQLLWSLPPLLVQLGTMAHNAWFQASGSHELGLAVLVKTWENLGVSVPLVAAYFGELSVRASFQAIPAVFVALVLLARPARLRGELAFVPVALLLFGLVLTLAFLKGNTEYDLKNAAARVLLQAIPLALLWIAAVAGELLGGAPRGEVQSRP